MNEAFFGRNTEESYLVTETLLIQKFAYIIAVFGEGD